MSVRFDSSTDALRRTTNIPSLSGITACGWAIQVVDTNFFAAIFSVENTTTNAPEGLYIGTGPDGTTLGIDVSIADINTQTAFPTQYGLGVWFFWALVGASSGNAARGYAARATDASLQSVSSVSGPTQTSAVFAFGNDSYTDFWNGSIFAFKVWDTALTEAEIEQERWSVLPKRLNNLVFFNPALDHSTATQDWTGTGNLTAAGTLVAADNPPIPYRGPSARRHSSLQATQIDMTPAVLSLSVASLSISQVVSLTSASVNLTTSQSKPTQAISLSPPSVSIVNNSTKITERISYQTSNLPLTFNTPALIPTLPPSIVAFMDGASTFFFFFTGGRRGIIVDMNPVVLEIELQVLTSSFVIQLSPSIVSLGSPIPTTYLSMSLVLETTDIEVLIDIQSVSESRGMTAASTHLEMPALNPAHTINLSTNSIILENEILDSSESLSLEPAQINLALSISGFGGYIFNLSPVISTLSVPQALISENFRLLPSDVEIVVSGTATSYVLLIEPLSVLLETTVILPTEAIDISVPELPVTVFGANLSEKIDLSNANISLSANLDSLSESIGLGPSHAEIEVAGLIQDTVFAFGPAVVALLMPTGQLRESVSLSATPVHILPLSVRPSENVPLFSCFVQILAVGYWINLDVLEIMPTPLSVSVLGQSISEATGQSVAQIALTVNGMLPTSSGLPTYGGVSIAEMAIQPTILIDGISLLPESVANVNS